MLEKIAEAYCEYVLNNHPAEITEQANLRTDMH